MSKGHGKLQRRLLQILNNADNDTPLFETEELAGRVYETRKIELGGRTRYLVTRAQVFAIQRALRKLTSEGAIVAAGRMADRKWWVNKTVWSELNAAVEAFRHRAEPP
jgi:hypothetical protein